jgi:putative spermidine/putrescine transport system substrate-binding protein
MKPRNPRTKPSLILTRRRLIQAAAATGVAGMIGPRAAHAAGRCVVGTWGGDYQNLIQKNIVPLMSKDIEVIYDTGNDSPRKTKMLAESKLPRGTMDISALSRAGSFEMYKAGRRSNCPTRSRTSIPAASFSTIRSSSRRSRPPTPISGIPNTRARSA